MGFAEYIYNQISGFARAGKNLQPAKNDAELSVSRVIAFLLILLTAGVAVFAYFFGNLAWNIMARAIFLFFTILLFAWKFYQGISISWILNGLLKYWFAFLLLVYAFVVVIYIFVELLLGTIGEYKLALIAGSLIFTLGFLLCITYLHGAKLADTKSGKTGAYFAALIWFGFVIGGLVGIAYGIGLADWFFKDVLRW